MTSLYREPETSNTLSWGALELRDVYRIFRSGPVETVALRGVSIRIDAGEFVALSGASGSGKSTLMRLAAGLDMPSAGDVVAFGRSLRRLKGDELADYRATVTAIVLQRGNLWSAVSALDNVELSLRLAGRPHGSKEVAREALAAFGLSGKERRRAVELSGGEQVRVALAAAAARQAPLVLGDEPTAELDEENEAIVLEAFEKLSREYGSAVVVVTHSGRVAQRADRAITVVDGRIAA